MLVTRIKPRMYNMLRLLEGGIEVQNGPNPIKISSVYNVLNVINGRGLHRTEVSKSTFNIAEAILAQRS